MNALKRKLTIQFTLLMLVLGWSVWLLKSFVFHTSVFEGYPFIPVIFYVVGLTNLNILFRSNKIAPLKLANLYLFLKMVKIFIFGGVALFYLIGLNVNKKVFIVVFAVFYLFYTVFDIFALKGIENEIKKKQ
jgi:hypothetical protein